MGEKPVSAKAKAPAKKTSKGARSAVGARPKVAKDRPVAKKQNPSKASRPSPRGRKSSAPSDARATPREPRKRPGQNPALAPNLPASESRGRGRPKDTPDVWTPEHIAEVADAMWDYVEKTAIPSVAEFCYLHLVRHQRLGEFEELREVRAFLQAKRAAALDRSGLSLTREDGPRGAYINKAIANVGDFSMVDKSETTEHVQSVNVYMPDNKRGDGPAVKRG